MDYSEMNKQVIDEFRANAGEVANERFGGQPVLLLHNTGAKSGEERITPLVYNSFGDSYIVFAAKGGAPENPDWYYNLRANPDVSVEVGDERFQGVATEVVGDERAQVLDATGAASSITGLESGISRTIPAIAIRRRE